MALRRIQSELRTLKKNIPPHVHVHVPEGNPYLWYVTVDAPVLQTTLGGIGGNFDNALYGVQVQLEVHFPEDYPFRAPRVVFTEEWKAKVGSMVDGVVGEGAGEGAGDVAGGNGDTTTEVHAALTAGGDKANKDKRRKRSQQYQDPQPPQGDVVGQSQVQQILTGLSPEQAHALLQLIQLQAGGGAQAPVVAAPPQPTATDQQQQPLPSRIGPPPPQMAQHPQPFHGQVRPGSPQNDEVPVAGGNGDPSGPVTARPSALVGLHRNIPAITISEVRLEVGEREWRLIVGREEKEAFKELMLIAEESTSRAAVHIQEPTAQKNFLLPLRGSSVGASIDDLPIKIQAWGRYLTVRVSSLDTTVSDCKYLIQAEEGFPVSAQELVFAGKHMDNGLTLKDYAVESGSTLFVLGSGCCGDLLGIRTACRSSTWSPAGGVGYALSTGLHHSIWGLGLSQEEIEERFCRDCYTSLLMAPYMQQAGPQPSRIEEKKRAEELHWYFRSASPSVFTIWTPETDKYWPFVFRKVIRYCLQIKLSETENHGDLTTIPHDVVAVIASFL